MQYQDTACHPGIMKAAEELNAVVAFELTRTEGGLDGGYTGQTPQVFFRSIIEYAEQGKFTMPFIVHGDHITVKDTSEGELAMASELLRNQIDTGFTSFALDASFNPVADNVRIIYSVAQPVISEGYCLEVELGEVKPVGSNSTLTTLNETEAFLSGLAGHGITPDLLAIDNGSKSGNYLEGEMVRIDLERTREIFRSAESFGLAGLVQHGITGTPLRIVGNSRNMESVKEISARCGRMYATQDFPSTLWMPCGTGQGKTGKISSTQQASSNPTSTLFRKRTDARSMIWHTVKQRIF